MEKYEIPFTKLKFQGLEKGGIDKIPFVVSFFYQKLNQIVRVTSSHHHREIRHILTSTSTASIKVLS